jgi:hypothetical protein
MVKDKMYKVIFKFLDSYVGDGVICEKSKQLRFNPFNPLNFKSEMEMATLYYIYSNNRTLILSFNVWNDGECIKIYRGNELCNMVSSFFSMDGNESMIYIREWFADKHDIKKVSDLMKFIPPSVNH